jgi:REP element-mobilizing transposase RayT
MTKARIEQISLDSTPFYHCYVRCVRRAFLCGEDHLTGANYEHRKQWIVSRLRFLSYVYAIDICAYAVMSNHYHVVLHVDAERAKGWSQHEVAERWMQLYHGDVLVNKWLRDPASVDPITLEKIDEIIESWRARLYDISWFMRGINETIARMANEEENCKGRFWEGRYRSQALLDEAALLSCMAYVDLNPVRAAMENNLEESDFTSIQTRLHAYAVEHGQTHKTLSQRIKKQQVLKQQLGLKQQEEAPLMEFDGSAHTDIHVALPFTQEDYFDLLDKTGRIIREGKRGFIPAQTPRVISQFGINPDKWIDHVKCFGSRYAACAGSADKLKVYAEKFQRRWAKGAGDVCRVYAA